MTRTHTFARVGALLACGALLLGACGEDAPADDGAAPATDDGASDGGATATTGGSEEGSGDGFGGVPSDLPDATYIAGEAHVEMSGGHDAAADFDAANGIGADDTIFLSFVDPESAESGFTLNLTQNDLESGFALTLDGVTTGGDFAELCDIEITDQSDSAIAGRFHCEAIDAVAATGILTVTVDGTFSAST